MNNSNTILYTIIIYLCMLVTNYYGAFKCKYNICFRLQMSLENVFSFICDFNVHWFVRFFFFICIRYAINMLMTLLRFIRLL